MQDFKTADVLRLEVEDDPTGLVNLVQNPSGDLGGWGWVTPLTQSSLARSSGALFYRRAVAGESHFYTEALPVAAGRWVAASYKIIGTGPAHYQRARFEYLNASFAVLSSSTQTALSGSTGTFNLGPFQAPASTAWVRLRIDVYTSGGANPTGDNFVYLHDATVAEAATSAALGTLRRNLVPNPSFETNATGWGGTDCTVARTTAQAHAGTASLALTATAGSPMARTLPGTAGVPVVGGQTYTAQARVRAATVARIIGVAFYWYNAAGVLISGGNTAGSSNSTSAWQQRTRSETAPSNAAFCAVAVKVVGAAVGEVHYVDAVMLEQGSAATAYFDGSTTDAGGVTYDWSAHPATITTRTNLVPNPSFETNATGWAGSAIGSTVTVTRVTTQFASGTASLEVKNTTNAVATMDAMTPSGTGGFAVQPGTYYGVRAKVRLSSNFTANNRVQVGIAFFDAAGASVGSTNFGGLTDVAVNSWHDVSVTFGLPPQAAAFARVIVRGVRDDGSTFAVNTTMHVDAVLVEQVAGSVLSPGAYFDGSTPDGTVDFGTADRAWTGTAHAPASTETTTLTLPLSTATTSNLGFIEPVPYLNVLGPTHNLRVVREALNVGTLEATILDASLDPSQGDLIRPGRRARLTVRNTTYVDGVPTYTWQPIFTGKVAHAAVTYELKDPAVPDAKRARVTMTVVDALAALSQQKRPEGVATVAALPYVLEGCGVPWNVNGSGNQVASATVVSRNDNASAVDQIAVTRDTVLGRAWVDQQGVVQVWGPDTRGLWPLVLSTTAYTDLDVDYDTERCINEVTIKFLRLNPATGDTEEVPYGPYRDEASISEWGVRSASFTIHGVSEETSAIPDLAAAILAANGTPQVRVNGVTVPIATEGWFGTISGADGDLYGLTRVVRPTVANPYDPQPGEFYDDARITRVEHTITPDKWLMRLGFETDGSVAAPTFVPSPGTGAGGKTIGQLLRPVGEVTMWFGAKADCPAGWLVMDGSAIPAAYADLIAMVGPNLPDMTDRFPIGAGTKALGTDGGSPTKTLVAANLPPHTHPINRQSGANTGGGTNVAVGNTTAATTGATGVNSGTSTAFDVMNPWRALWFIIRAV